MLSRRKLLGATAALGLGGLTTSLGGCAGPVRTRPNRALLRTPLAAEPARVALGWSTDEPIDDVCRRLLERAGGLPWLTRGDSVLVKVASNSPNEHPAVSSPEALGALVRLLRDSGAGRILVGDQAGVEHVRLTADGSKSSTREVMATNGLAHAAERAGAELACFDERGWGGYVHVEPDFESHWEEGVWLARALEEVDHVIYLPRLSAHALAGVTLGTKNAVGWLRDDSRLHLHQRGDSFFEQIAELNQLRPLRERLRLVLTMGRQALLDIGPDFGTVLDLGAIVSIASCELLEHDLLASALLGWLDDRTDSFFDAVAPYPLHADFHNRRFVVETWGKKAGRDYRHLIPHELGRSLAHDRCLSHLAMLRGHRPSRIVVDRAGERVPIELVDALRAEPEGLFVV